MWSGAQWVKFTFQMMFHLGELNTAMGANLLCSYFNIYSGLTHSALECIKMHSDTI